MLAATTYAKRVYADPAAKAFYTVAAKKTRPPTLPTRRQRLPFPSLAHDCGRAPADPGSESEPGVAGCRNENSRLHALFTAFKAATGTGVLCNTSLNFKGKGFINRTTHLMKFADARGIGVVVINDRLLVRNSTQPAPSNGAAGK